ncbi:MAG TPA: DUF4032 domain-containing protein [Opitutales bacterium]|jgi:hypothetical protein|nr:DUF4032 domain-containing protein [Opitutales bacterium]
MAQSSMLAFGRYSAIPHSRLLDEKMKTPDASTTPGSHDFVIRSSVYQEFLAEREEILRHKWLQSEKAGHDVGFETALLDWMRNHRDKWRASRRTGNTSAGLNLSN